MGNEEKGNHSLIMLSIVAIVAIVGLVIMFRPTTTFSSANTVPTEYVADNSAGNTLAGDARFIGSASSCRYVTYCSQYDWVNRTTCQQWGEYVFVNQTDVNQTNSTIGNGTYVCEPSSTGVGPDCCKWGSKLSSVCTRYSYRKICSAR